MIVVADSGPLHYRFFWSRRSFCIAFTWSRSPGIDRQQRAPTCKDWILKPPSWFRAQPVLPNQLDLVTDRLDPGEREAIALARLLGADLLLIDEFSGRAEARRRSLRVTGTPGILLRAAERGPIDVPEVLARLRGTNFSVNENLISSIFGEWQMSS